MAEGRHGRRRGGLEALFRGDSGLVLTFALGLWFAGVMTVLVMAVGTGVTVAALSLSALGFRVPLVSALGALGLRAGPVRASSAVSAA